MHIFLYPDGRQHQHLRRSDGGVVPARVLRALLGGAARVRRFRRTGELQGPGPRSGLPGGVRVGVRQPGTRRRPRSRVVPAEVRGLPPGAKETHPRRVVKGGE